MAQRSSAVSRRQFLQFTAATGGLAGIGLLAACAPLDAPGGSGSGTGRELTAALEFGSIGGLNETIARDVAAAGFVRDYPGTKVTVTPRLIAEQYPKVVAAGSRPVESAGPWNDIFDARGEVAGLWRPVSKDFAPALTSVTPGLYEGSGVPITVQPFGIAYNPDFTDAPTSWLDLLDPRFEGRLAMMSVFWDAYVMLNRALGADDLDFEVSVGALKEARANLRVFSESYTETLEMLDKGEVWVAPAWGGFTSSAQLAGSNVRFAYPKEGCTQATSIVNVCVGLDESTDEAAQRFAGFMLEEGVQKAFLEQLQLSPTNSTIEIGEEYADLPGVVTGAAQADLVRYDFEAVGESASDITELIKRELA
jgi:putative spermidine/putrescine transport system substrate-binding protein